MVVESEETYLQEFDLDNSHQDTAMREARDDWLLAPNGCGKAEEARQNEVRGGDGL
jgi:hypothetical protein